MLWGRYSNVLTTPESDVVTPLETDVGTTLIFDRATMLWQRQQGPCHNVVTMSLCQLGYIVLMLYLEIFKTLNSVIPCFMQELFKLRETKKNVYKYEKCLSINKYKLNLGIPIVYFWVKYFAFFAEASSV